MTRREYQKRKRANKKAFARLMRFNLTKIRAEYVKAIQGFKKAVARLPSTSLSEANRTRLEAAIPRTGLFETIKQIVRDSGETAMKADGDIDVEYLAESFEKAGLEITEKDVAGLFERQRGKILERYQIANAFMPVSRMVSERPFLLQNRASYTLSDSVWGSIDSFTDKIIAYVQGSLNQGIDPVTISRDLEKYLREGSEFVIGRWGKLEPGTAEYKKRLGKAGADYRTQRVVRTELYQMIRDNSISTGTLNPGCTGMFNWVLSPVHLDWGCDCAEIAAGSPYTSEQVQGYSDSIHPNCHDGETFIKTPEGEKKIKELTPGELIVSHDGTIREISHVWKQWYSGNLLTIKTADKTVRVTPNHPLLTDRGWIEAQFLKPGDNLVGITTDGKPELFVERESHNLPANGSEESKFFIIGDLFFRTGVPVTAINFDGKFFVYKGEINIESKDSEVGERLFAKSDKGIIQNALISAPEFSGIELRYGNSVFVRLGGPADSVMSGTGVSNPPVGISTSLPLGNRGQCESMSSKVSVDTRSRDIEDFGYLVNRKVLVNKQIVDRVIGKVVCSTHNNSIVSVSSKKYKGYVYNLTVQGTHTYIANGIGSHNCLCTLEPELMDDEAFMQSLEDYVKDEDTAGARDIEIWAIKYGLTA